MFHIALLVLFSIFTIGLTGCGKSDSPSPASAAPDRPKGEGFIVVNRGKGKVGIIDNQGNWIFKPTLQTTSGCSEGLIAIQRKLFGPVVVMDISGKELFTTPYGCNPAQLPSGMDTFYNGLMPVRPTMNSEEVHYYDTKGTNLFTLPGKVEGPDYYRFRDGMLPVKKDKQWGYIDSTGRFVIQPIYKQANSFGDGLAPVKLDDKFGFINKQGETVIEPLYAWAGSFSEGLANVKIKYKFGYIDTKGTIVIDFVHQTAGPFSEGYAIVGVKNKYKTFIDKQGKQLTEPLYTHVLDFSEGMAAVKTEENWGFIDTSGTLVIPQEYTKVESFKYGIAKVWKGDTEVFIRKDGSELVIAPE